MKKTFIQMREGMRKGMPPGDHVFDKKVGRTEVMVHKEKGKFVTYIDREKLDSYNSLSAAKTAGLAYVKQAKQ